METNKITQDEFNSLFGEDITVRTQKELVAKITNRVNEIIRKIAKVSWWDFCGGEGEVEGDFFKSFYSDKKFIRLDGEYGLPEVYDCGSEWFPTHWLWTDYEAEFEQDKINFEKAKEEKKQKNIEKKKRKAANAKIHAANQERIWKSISEKLTKEEMLYICLR